jgi:hypothetical protein
LVHLTRSPVGKGWAKSPPPFVAPADGRDFAPSPFRESAFPRHWAVCTVADTNDDAGISAPRLYSA